MDLLFSNYILLNTELESKGGRGEIVDNPDLEELYDQVFSIENEILQKFGLPKLIKFREIIFELNAEEDVERVNLKLKNAAEGYLLSVPVNDIELLNDAKTKGLKTYDVLPEIGFDDTIYATFYFEEYFKKGKIDAKRLIEILKSIDEETSDLLGQLQYYQENDLNLLEAEKAYKALKDKQVPFLNEFRDYKPVYPY